MSRLSNIYTSSSSTMISEMEKQLVKDITNFLVERGHDKRKITLDIKDYFNSKPDNNKTNYDSSCSNESPQLKSNVNLYIVLDYSDKVHAVFGDTKYVRKEFNSLNETSRVISFNPNLTFGPGWIIIKKLSLPNVEKILNDKGIQYTKMSRDDYIKLKNIKLEPKEQNVINNDEPKQTIPKPHSPKNKSLEEMVDQDDDSDLYNKFSGISFSKKIIVKKPKTKELKNDE